MGAPRPLRFVSGVVLLLLLGAMGFVARARESAPLRKGVVADRILVDKSDRTLTLYEGARLLKTYKVTFGRSPAGAKQREGDDRTPEGRYFIDGRNRGSRYHFALHVSYPNAGDLRRAQAGGYKAGGDIMIHGLRSGFGWLGSLHRSINWTHGCIAVTNAEIDEIARAVPNGTPIDIQP